MMDIHSAQAYIGQEAEAKIQSQPICPFCGGILVRLSHFVRCSRCLFEFCDECGGADREE